MNRNCIIIAIVIIVIIGGALFLFAGKAEAPMPEQGSQGTPVGNDTSAVVPAPGSEEAVEETVVAPSAQTSTTENENDDEDVIVEEQITPPVEQTAPPVEQPSAEQESPPTETVSVAVITYTNNGFSPKIITISKGDTVQFINESSSLMWIASDIHPTHSLYPIKSGSDCLGSSFDQCAASQNGGVWEYTFTETGSHGYHNHRQVSKRGVVIVN